MSTSQDYQAAEQLLRRPARPGELVMGDKVRPQWIDGGARFWYAVSNGVGRRFVLVTPAAGTRRASLRPRPARRRTCRRLRATGRP
jgi:dipeptidyl-peptidase 4